MAHLGPLRRIADVDVWNDDRIAGGDDWESEIRAAMARADIAVFLVTANFLSSEFISFKEVPTLLQRRDQEGLRVLPIIARDCAWALEAWMEPINVRPKNGTPIWSSATGRPDDTALKEIVHEIAGLAGLPATAGGSTASAPVVADAARESDRLRSEDDLACSVDELYRAAQAGDLGQIAARRAEARQHERALVEIERDPGGGVPARRRQRFDEDFPKIDFRDAVGAVREIDQKLGDGGAAVFLIPKSRKTGGTWCATRIRGILSRGVGDVRLFSIECSSSALRRLDAFGLLDALARDVAGATAAPGDELADYCGAVRQKLCDVARGSSGTVVWIEIRRCQCLEPRAGFLAWFVEHFWRPLRQELEAVFADYAVKFIVVLEADNDPLQQIPALCCTAEDFDPAKIVRLDLPRRWEEEEIRDWLRSHASYFPDVNTKAEIDNRTREILDESDGEPQFVYDILSESLGA